MGADESLYETVAAPERRAICRYLATTDEERVPLEDLATHLVTEGLCDEGGSPGGRDRDWHATSELHHVHLPKLDDAAVLRYDPGEWLVEADSELPMAVGLIRDVQE